ncbi:MAG: radical SAM protein [Syntrophobacterales bacterium]|jgi:MoaA/NifB/PqqE/SkfB family radical SAM enzyme|nr:radical SAM protein [Syntrophobacterales bacterium]
MTTRELLHLILEGGPGFCQIAVTNTCNAHCSFCSFPGVAPAARVMADSGKLHRGLAALKSRGVRYVCFTGGEPLLYPDLLPALARARDLEIHTLLCTNASRLDSAYIRNLQAAGLQTLIISLDAPSAAAHDTHRGLPGLTAHIRELMPELRRAGLDPVASVTLSRLIGDLGEMVRFLNELGFHRVTFSYPITRLHSSYLGFADHASVDFNPDELYRWFSRVKEVKATSPLHILNPDLALTDLQRQLEHRPGRFPCLAGFKYFFVDWHLQVYRCHYLDESLCSLEEIGSIEPIRDNCTACAIDCYRDPSVCQYLAVSVADGLAALRRGRWLQGLGSLLHPYNFLSLSALWEGWHWLGS